VPLQFEPVQQADFGRAEIGIRDTDLLEAKLPSPGLDVGGEADEIDIIVSCGTHQGLSYKALIILAAKAQRAQRFLYLIIMSFSLRPLRLCGK
jgi:hypothetical protein